jgi:hypothetical protein
MVRRESRKKKLVYKTVLCEGLSEGGLIHSACSNRMFVSGILNGGFISFASISKSAMTFFWAVRFLPINPKLKNILFLD